MQMHAVTALNSRAMVHRLKQYSSDQRKQNEKFDVAHNEVHIESHKFPEREREIHPE